jgi:hypothetical protein
VVSETCLKIRSISRILPPCWRAQRLGLRVRRGWHCRHLCRCPWDRSIAYRHSLSSHSLSACLPSLSCARSLVNRNCLGLWVDRWSHKSLHGFMLSCGNTGTAVAGILGRIIDYSDFDSGYEICCCSDIRLRLNVHDGMLIIQYPADCTTFSVPNICLPMQSRCYHPNSTGLKTLILNWLTTPVTWYAVC